MSMTSLLAFPYYHMIASDVLRLIFCIDHNHFRFTSINTCILHIHIYPRRKTRVKSTVSDRQSMRRNSSHTIHPLPKKEQEV